MVQAASQRWGVPPELLAAQIEAESSFDPNAVSPAGAIGIAQFMPDTARSLGVNPRDPASAIDGMARLMSNYFKKYGSWDKALIAYHDGPGGVDDPSNNARNYVDKIMGKIQGYFQGVVPEVVNPIDAVSNIAKLLQTIRDPAFLKRIGLGALGVAAVVFGIVAMIRGTVGTEAKKVILGETVRRVSNRRSVGTSRSNARSDSGGSNGD
jgi:hypothetical protein